MAQVRWTVEQAASAWGVSPKRIYKWIKGRSGSKGGGRRDEPGSRRRLFEGQNYVKENFPRGPVYIILDDTYPAPVLTKIDRPLGIRPMRSEPVPREVMQVSSEEIVREAVSRPKKSAPVSVTPQPVQPQTIEERATGKAEAGMRIKKKGQPPAPPKAAPAPQTFEERAGEPEAVGTDDVLQSALAQARGLYAQQVNAKVGSVSDQTVANAIQSKSIRTGTEIPDVINAIWSAIYTSRSDEPWTRTDSAQQVREAFFDHYERLIEQSLDGLAAFQKLRPRRGESSLLF